MELGWQKIATSTDMGNIGNLEYSLRIAFINEKCGNHKVVVESLLEIFSKRKSQTFTGI